MTDVSIRATIRVYKHLISKHNKLKAGNSTNYTATAKLLCIPIIINNWLKKTGTVCLYSIAP